MERARHENGRQLMDMNMMYRSVSRLFSFGWINDAFSYCVKRFHSKIPFKVLSHVPRKGGTMQCLDVLGSIFFLPEAEKEWDVMSALNRSRPVTTVNIAERLVGFHLRLLLSRETVE